MNPFLSKVLKKIRLFCFFGSNVVASLRQALLGDALGGNLTKAHSRYSVKVGLIEWECYCKILAPVLLYNVSSVTLIPLSTRHVLVSYILYHNNTQ